MRGLPQKKNARRAYKIRLCGHLRRYKKIVKKTYIIFIKFYPRAWAKYPEAIPGTLKLIPPEYRFPALISDYEVMKDMLYGDIPSFNTIMESVCQLEKEINSL